MTKSTRKVALITGAAHRIGATIARTLHAKGFNIVLHYRNSAQGALQLQQELSSQRTNSVELVQGDLLDVSNLCKLVQRAFQAWNRLDVLINNASTFYPTPMGEIGENEWSDLLGTNVKAPFFLSQAAVPYLKQKNGCIVNIVDIHAMRPLKSYSVYSIAKAGLAMLTKSLACELGPEIRVNGVAPGAILWPEKDLDDIDKQKIVSRTFLKRQGVPLDIAKAVQYLVLDGNYVTGQILTVDGGRSLNS